MMEEEDGNKLRYCKVCRVHNGNGRKHQYSRNHRKAFDSLIDRFKKKVTDCRQFFKDPEAVDGELEPGATFWCHFCEEAVQKHVTDKVISIKFGGLFEHFRSDKHHKKTHAFWKENGGDKALKKNFLICVDEFTRYQQRCKESMQKLSDEMDLSRTQVAERIKVNEVKRLKVFSEQHQLNQALSTKAQTLTNSHGVMQNATGRHEGLRVWRGGIVKGRSRNTAQNFATKWNNGAALQLQDDSITNTLAARLPALSVVKLPVDATSRRAYAGNIHTGALPPWLRNEDEDSRESDLDKKVPAIGPSLEDFKQHVAKTKKKRMHSRSVGKNFDHTPETSDNWLPSFGRVWNSGPRWQSRREYRKEQTATNSIRQNSEERCKDA